MFGVGGDPKTYHVSNICTQLIGHKCTEVISLDRYYVSETQLTLVLIEKDLLQGSSCKMEDKQVSGV